MDKLYIETKGSLMQLNDLLIKFDQSITTDDGQTFKAEINERLGHIGKNCDQLDIFVTKEPAARRFDSKLKVDQLKYDFQHYKAAFGSMQYKK